MASTTTLPRKRASESETVRPSRSGKATARGADGSFTPVWWKGSAGSPGPWARALAGRSGEMGAERIRASVADVTPFQRSAGEVGLQAAAVLIEVQTQRTFLDLSAGGGHAFVSVEEVALERAAVGGELHAEGDVGAVDGDGAIPPAGERLRDQRGGGKNGSGDESCDRHSVGSMKAR